MIHSESDMRRIWLHHCSLCTVYILLMISFIFKSLVGKFAASVCSTQHLERVYFYLSQKSMGRFSSPSCNEVTHLPLSTSLSPSSWCWRSVLSTTSMARRKTLRGWAYCVDRTTMHGDTKRPGGKGKKMQIAAVFSLRLDQVEWQVLPLDITLLLLHPKDDGGSLTGSLFLVNLCVRACVWSCAI